MADAWDVFPKVANSSPAGWDQFPQAPSASGFDFDRPNEDVRADIARLPEGQRKGALKAWAKHFVAKERKGGGVGQTVTDTVRNVARGTPIGSWLDEANAATSSAPYDEAVEYQRATDKAIDDEATKLFRVPGTSYDVTTADAAKVAGGVASARLAPIATIFRGATMLPRMANAALSGLGYGALYGAGQGEGLQDRAMEAGKGAAAGFALGAVAEPVARGVGNAVGAARDAFRRTPQPLQQYERGAVNALTRSTTDDALAGRYGQQAADLGPEGMLADMGANMRGQASALANQPGEGQQLIRDALHTRRQGAAGRISQDVDQALGPAANIPETIDATQQFYRGQAAPHRQAFQQNPVPYTQQLDDTLQLLAQHEPGVIRSAERLAAIDNRSGPQQWFARQMPDGSYQIERVPNANEWDYIKRALDDMGQSPEANLRRIYGGLARRVREGVDEAISPGAPDQSPWARARALEAEDFQIRDAVDAGRGAFNRELSPDQMRAELYGVGQPPRGGMTPPEIAGYGVGARDQVRSIMGNASTAHGENAAAAARSKLGSDYAREKLDIVAGPQAAGQLTRRLDAETTFDQTRQAVTQNSATAGRLQAQREFPNAADRTETARGIGQRSLGGAVMEGAYKIGNLLVGGALDERRIRVARDAAEMLIAQGAQRDQIANALFRFAGQRQLSQQQRQALSTLIGQVMQGGRQRAIEGMDAE